MSAKASRTSKNYEGNTGGNHQEMPPPTQEDGYHQKPKDKNFCQGYEKTELLHTFGMYVR
jgi:hypothetical protein